MACEGVNVCRKPDCLLMQEGSAEWNVLSLFSLVDTMLRRKPTRLELKIDDTEEFESVKKELEVGVTDNSNSRRACYQLFRTSANWMQKRVCNIKILTPQYFLYFFPSHKYPVLLLMYRMRILCQYVLLHLLFNQRQKSVSGRRRSLEVVWEGLPSSASIWWVPEPPRLLPPRRRRRERSWSTSGLATSRIPNLPHCRHCLEAYSFKKKPVSVCLFVLFFLNFLSKCKVVVFFLYSSSKVDLNFDHVSFDF